MAHWPITLSDALLIVLQDAPGRTASTESIAKAINDRRISIQKVGGPVFAEQIFLRVQKDAEFFEVLDRTTLRSRFGSRRRGECRDRDPSTP